MGHSHKNHEWTEESSERFIRSVKDRIQKRYENFINEIYDSMKKNNIDKNGVVLDLGCGPGFLLFELKNLIPAIKIIGIDASDLMINTAIEKAKEKKIQNFEFKKGFAENIPINDDFCNVVTCFNSLHDFKEPKKAFSEVYRILEKDGVFILEDKNPSYPKWKMKIYFFFMRFKIGKERSKRYYKSSYHWIPPQDIEGWMKELNFNVKFISKSVDYIVVGKK